MITAYFLIAAFVMGGYVGGVIAMQEKLCVSDWILLAFMSAVWPLMIPLWIYERTKS